MLLKEITRRLAINVSRSNDHNRFSGVHDSESALAGCRERIKQQRHPYGGCNQYWAHAFGLAALSSHLAAVGTGIVALPIFLFLHYLAS